MTKTRIIGDIHGKWSAYRKLCEAACAPSIQVGDFGIGFLPADAHSYMNQWAYDCHYDRSFIRGNHDMPGLCEQMTGWIPDGTVKGEVMFVGGAWSIDHAWRTPGVDWWEDEELNFQQWDIVIDTYLAMKPKVMITHDCPEFVAKSMFVDTGQSLGGDVMHHTRTGQALQMMFREHQPERWYFGHWHVSKIAEIEGTRFTCLGELDFVDTDLPI